jgi:hypothetical protein
MRTIFFLNNAIDKVTQTNWLVLVLRIKVHSSREILNPTTSYSIFDIRSPTVLYCHLVNSLENH